MSGLVQGLAGMNAGIYNARAAEIEGHQAQTDAAAQAEALRHDARMTQGEAIAAQGTSGLQIGTGSPLDVLRENTLVAELDQLAVRTRANNQQAAKRAEASRSRKAAFLALVGGITKTATDATGLFAGRAQDGGSASVGGSGVSSYGTGFLPRTLR